jgi:hypothetical protein
VELGADLFVLVGSGGRDTFFFLQKIKISEYTGKVSLILRTFVELLASQNLVFKKIYLEFIIIITYSRSLQSFTNKNSQTMSGKTVKSDDKGAEDVEQRGKSVYGSPQRDMIGYGGKVVT